MKWGVANSGYDFRIPSGQKMAESTTITCSTSSSEDTKQSKTPAVGTSVLSLNANQKDAGRGSQPRYPYGPMIFILGTTMGQSYSSTGLQSVLEQYFAHFLYVCSTNSFALSTTSVNVYIAVYQLCALSAGFLADRVLGNFITQNISNIICSVGICLITFASWQYTLQEPSCCLDKLSPNCSEFHKVVIWTTANLHISPTVNVVLAITGLTLFAVGYGHTNAIQSVFVGDQFRQEQSKSKERSFSWYYLWMNLGNLAGEVGMPILRQTVGFIVTFITVVGAMVSSTVVFLLGTFCYIKKRPQRIACKCSCCKRNQSTIKETQPLLNSRVTERVSLWSLLLRWRELVPFLGVFAPLLVFWAIFYQQNSTWVQQGDQMDCYLGTLHVPPDLMPGINDFLVVAIIPLLDYLVYPHLERTMGIQVKPMHKFVAGMTLAALSFIMAGLLQLYIHGTAEKCHGDVNIAWQLPQLVLISFAEVLVSVTGLEFSYSQAPPDFRNVITSLWFISQALGVLLNAGVAQIPMSLTYEFFVYAAVMMAVTGIFLLINRNFQYRNNSKMT